MPMDSFLGRRPDPKGVATTAFWAEIREYAVSPEARAEIREYAVSPNARTEIREYAVSPDARAEIRAYAVSPEARAEKRSTRCLLTHGRR